MLPRKLNAALDARQKGLPPTDDRITLERHLMKWLADVVKPSVRASTYDSYESVVRVHLVPALGKRRLTSIQPEDVQKFLSDSAAQGKWSTRTVNYWRRVLSMALGQATAWGRVNRNVAGKGRVKPAKGPSRQIQPLEPDQVARFVAATRGRSMEHLFLLDLSTGLRTGELLVLRWKDDELAGGWLEIRQGARLAQGATGHVRGSQKRRWPTDHPTGCAGDCRS